VPEKPEILIFEALCERYRSAPAGGRTMALKELQMATGLPEADLRHALYELRGGPIHPADDSKIAYEGERIMLGWLWRDSCRHLMESR
jgi:hypothetical protein